jgi:large subunit ribosomal protein L18
MIEKISRNELRMRRHSRIRKKLLGTKEKPRVSVFRSIKQIYAQIIDDETGSTLVAASSLEKALRESVEGTPRDIAKKVGQLLAEKAKTKGITTIVFDRGGYKFHGRIAALAEGMREAGLEF